MGLRFSLGWFLNRGDFGSMTAKNRNPACSDERRGVIISSPVEPFNGCELF